MCQFCTKHGDGKKWYLQARNYSDDLVSDARRQKIIQDYAGAAISEERLEGFRKGIRRADWLASLPGVLKSIPGWLATHRLKREHFGQVVPIEDIAKILKMVNTIVRLPCICRRALGQEHAYCLGISMKPDLGLMGDTLRMNFEEGPDIDAFERLTPEHALALMRDWEREGVVHTVWTFGTPFIAGICNCDRIDCAAMRMTVTQNIKIMFRGEYVARVDEDLCTGCRSCMRVCQFGALSYRVAREKVGIDEKMCYGCGVCRSMCERNAISLVDRASVPQVAKLW